MGGSSGTFYFIPLGQHKRQALILLLEHAFGEKVNNEANNIYNGKRKNLEIIDIRLITNFRWLQGAREQPLTLEFFSIPLRPRISNRKMEKLIAMMKKKL